MFKLARQLVGETITQPRRAARRVMQIDLDLRVLIEIAVATAAISAVLQYLFLVSWPKELLHPFNPDPGMPLLTALLQFGQLFLTAFFVTHVGRMFGGGGAFLASLKALLLLNVVGLFWQLALLVGIHMMFSMAFVFMVALIGWSIWAFASFVAEIHGFQSLWKVIGVSMVASVIIIFALLIVLSILMTLAGYTPPEMS